MLPIGDDNPSGSRPWVNWTIIVACAVIFVWMISLGEIGYQRILIGAGLIPARLLGQPVLPESFPALPAWATLIAHMFLHAGPLHLAGNILYLWIFGDNVEDALGHRRYAVFYLGCGLVAALAQVAVIPDATIPVVGASGAISGVLGAYIVLFPKANVRTLVPIPFFLRVVNIPAYVVLIVWVVLQIGSAALSTPEDASVAFAAHLGGFVTGALLILFLRRPHVPLWQDARSRAFVVRRVGLGG
jgi:membrane associated rhomboid family serine protease